MTGLHSITANNRSQSQYINAFGNLPNLKLSFGYARRIFGGGRDDAELV